MSRITYCDVPGCGDYGKSQVLWINRWKKEGAKHFDLCDNCLAKINRILEGNNAIHKK